MAAILEILMCRFKIIQYKKDKCCLIISIFYIFWYHDMHSILSWLNNSLRTVHVKGFSSIVRNIIECVVICNRPLLVPNSFSKNMMRNQRILCYVHCSMQHFIYLEILRLNKQIAHYLLNIILMSSTQLLTLQPKQTKTKCNGNVYNLLI